MAESAAHKERVAGLVGWMGRQGVTVTHASGGLNLPDPYKIGRHEPDAIGIRGGVIWLGEAKVGGDPFILCVPKGLELEARQAVIEAGGSEDNLTVIA